MKTEDGFAIAALLGLVGLVFSTILVRIGVFCGIIYVIYHFVSKFW